MKIKKKKTNEVNEVCSAPHSQKDLKMYYSFGYVAGKLLKILVIPEVHSALHH